MASTRQPSSLRALFRRPADAAIVAALGLGLTLLSAALVVAPPSLIRYLDARVYDAALKQADFPAPDAAPVLVGIDEASLQHYGQWPWPRYRLAQLIDRLDRAGAQVIALDLLMPEPDRTSPDILRQERSRDLGVPPPSQGCGDGLPGNDQTLAAVLARTPVVLGYKFDFSPTGTPLAAVRRPPLKETVIQDVGGAAAAWPRPSGVLENLPLLAAAAPTAGFTNAGADEDGILRRVPLLVLAADGGAYPSLALATLLHATGAAQLRVTITPEAATVYWQGREIPLDGRGNLLLPFRGPHHSYPFHSAADILAGRVPDNALQGRVVLVGAWAAGLGDRHVTPTDRRFPGLAVHATVIDTLLAGYFLQEPTWARGARLFLVIGLGLFMTVVLSRYGFLADLLLLLAGCALVLGGSQALFAWQGIYLSPVLPLLLLLAGCGLLSLVKYGLEVRKVYVRTCELATAQDATILGMTLLAASRDRETGAHILRTQRYVEALARELRRTEKYRAELTEENIRLLFKSAPLHDIGKVGIPDAILRKPGPLSDDEYQRMQSHPAIGAEALAGTKAGVRQSDGLGYLDYACQITATHHEKWDGSGYPAGLKGEEIPLAGRLMAVADVYDALISERVYKSGYPHDQARAMILARSGGHFDPDVVAAFLRCEATFQQIARAYADQPEQA